MLALVVALALIPVVSSSASPLGPSPPVDILHLRLDETALSPVAKLVVQKILAKKAPYPRLVDLIQVHPSTIDRQLSQVASEISNYLDSYNLRLNMSVDEIRFYSRFGRLPYLGDWNGSTEIGALDLPTQALHILQNAGIESLDDGRKTSVEELHHLVNAGPVWISKIQTSFQTAGFPLYLTRNEREYNEAIAAGLIESGDPSPFVRSLDISGPAMRVLIQLGIKTFEEARRTSLEELREIPGVGPATISELKKAFKKVGFPLFRTKKQRQCQTQLETPGKPANDP